MTKDAGTPSRAPRLFVDVDLAAGARLDLEKAQVNYLANVLRLGEGDAVCLFNGRDGEWLARVERVARKAAVLVCETQTRRQDPRPSLVCAFAPLKHARLDYMVQKATEMGAGVLQPVITERTIARRVNLERMRANAVEAAEQCTMLSVPEVREALPLERFLRSWPGGDLLVFCDETAPSASPLAVLSRHAGKTGGVGVVIGPEGGFTEAERRLIAGCPGSVAISLGPRIMRADTAAVAAMAVVQASLGDWPRD